MGGEWPNGRPTVNFDGDDLIWTSKNFESELTNYSILTVARYTGGDNERVISSRGRNWMFGFHGNSIRRFHSDGWLHHEEVQIPFGTYMQEMLATRIKRTSGSTGYSWSIMDQDFRCPL